MSDQQPFKRCKLDNDVKKSSGTPKSLDQQIKGEDEAVEGVEMSTLEGNKNDQEEVLVEIPSLVVEQFLQLTQDVKLLKTCRLVNKYWNSLACSSLQDHSIAKLDYFRLQEFLKIQESEPSADLSLNSTPFKTVHLHTHNYKDENLFKLTKIPNITITSLETCKRDDSTNTRGMEGLNQFLKVIMKDLRSLTIPALQCERTQRIFHEVKFSALETLCILTMPKWSSATGLSTFRNNGDLATCNCTEHLNAALENLSLQKLTLGTKIDRSLSSETVGTPYLPSNLLSGINLSGIVEFNLSDQMEEIAWNGLPQLQLPSLKAFSFCQNSKLLNEAKQNQLNGFLRNVASNLNSLVVSRGPEPDFNLIFRKAVFPELKFLRVTCPSNISSVVTRGRFPSLESLYLRLEKAHSMDGSDSLSTVSKLDFLIAIDDDDNGWVDMFFPRWMLNLAKHFPGVTNLGVRFYPSWVSFSLLDIFQAYPDLEILRIKAYTPEWFLSGECTIQPKPYNYVRRTEGEMLNQANPFEAALMDLKLKSLDLDCIEISSEGFQRCLSRMVALEELTFLYMPGPSVELLVCSLRHVEKVTIVRKFGEKKADRTIRALIDALPLCEITIK